MEHDKSGDHLEEDNNLPLTPDRYTEESGLKSNINNDNNINKHSKNNDNTYIELSETKESNTDSTINNLNIKSNNNLNINSNLVLNNNPVNISSVTRSTQLKLFIPIVSIKILIPVFFMLKYIRFSFENEEDQNYCKYSVCILTSLIFLCYFLAVFTSPYQTNVDKYFDETKNNILIVRADNPGNEIQNLNPTSWDNCDFCKSKKFVRSSHCRTCNKCILLRDHHCPYIASCVGFKNMQYFLNFLFWGDFGMLFYVISFIKYHFFSDVKKNFVMPIYVKVIFYLDFCLTFFFVINLFGLMTKLFVNIYNNRTQLENLRGRFVEYYCPVCPKCAKNFNFNMFNIEPEVNMYNVGFLENLYYIIGPTPFHFIFPLPKYNNYLLDENCPVFKKTKMPERLDLFKFIVKKDSSNIKILEQDESSPLVYVKSCHQFYDGKKIV